MLIARLTTWWEGRWKAERERLLPESRVIVTTDDQGIRAAYPDGRTQQIRWNQIVRVSIETDDSGPWGADVWWIFDGSDERVAYPQGATGENEAMGVYGERLHGFNWEAVVRANGSTSNARFICWEKHRAG